MSLNRQSIDFIESSNDIRVVIVNYVTNFGPVTEDQIGDWLRQEYNPLHIPYILDYWLPELESHGEIKEINGMWNEGTIQGELGRPRGWTPMAEVRSLIRMIILESAGTAGHKMIFLAGLPGGGKSTLLKQLGIQDQFTNCNIDNFYEPRLRDELGQMDLHTITVEYNRLNKKRKAALEDGTDLQASELEEFERLSDLVSRSGSMFHASINDFRDQVGEVCQIGSNFIIDGTAASRPNTIRDKQKYEEMGYDCAMIFVDIDVDTSVERNIERGKSGGRSIWSQIIRNQGNRVPQNIEPYRELFGPDRFFLVSNRGSFEEYKEAIEEIRPGVQAFMES